MLDLSIADIVSSSGAQKFSAAGIATTFDDDVAAVLAKGTLRVSWERVRVAVHDPRLMRQHLKVLFELLACMNAKDGTAWPSTARLARCCDLDVRTVQNVLYRLRKLRYLTWEKRTGCHGRRLVHYTIPGEGPACIAGRANSTSFPLPAMQNSALPAVQQNASPAVQQELKKEPIKEKNMSFVADTPARELRSPKAPNAPLIDQYFDHFWSVYPRKEGKLKAKDVFAAIMKGLREGQHATAETIIAAAEKFARKRVGQDHKFTPHPATWLIQGRWDDEPCARECAEDAESERIYLQELAQAKRAALEALDG